MKLQLDAKNPRVVIDENGDQVFIFTGLHLDDLRKIVYKFNGGHEVI